MWSHVNNITGHSKQHKTVICDTLPLDSPNQYFQTVAIGLTHQGAECFVIPQDSLAPNPFTFGTILISLVKSHLKSLNVSKSTGPSNLSTRFLRTIADTIAIPLIALCELGRSLLSGSVLILLLFIKGEPLIIQVISG